MSTLGGHLRRVREDLLAKDPSFTLRQVARRAEIEPAYLSKVERGLAPPPGERSIRRLAKVLGENEDVLLALAGKVSTDLQEIIRRRPKEFAELIRVLGDAPDHAILRVVREVRDGDW